MPLCIQHLDTDNQPVSHRWSMEILFRIRRVINEIAPLPDGAERDSHTFEHALTMLDPWDENEDAITFQVGDSVQIWRDF